MFVRICLTVISKTFIIYWLAAILYVLASRFFARGFLNQVVSVKAKTRVAIYGAGRAGSFAGKRDHTGYEYLPIIFIDDDPQRVNTTIRGIKVYPSRDLERLAKDCNITTVLLAMPQLSRMSSGQSLIAWPC